MQGGGHRAGHRACGYAQGRRAGAGRGRRRRGARAAVTLEAIIVTYLSPLSQAYDKVTLGAKCVKGDPVEMANSFQKQMRKARRRQLRTLALTPTLTPLT
eukprot:scaffold41633_cov49-Phaeocystis_antarctica.AAC.1